MKKIIFILTLFVGLGSAYAQNGKVMINSLNSKGVYPTADTVVNAAVAQVSLYSPSAAVTTSVEFVATKISGTIAGTVSLQGSNDGVHYASISSTTFTATDVASQAFVWQLTGSPVSNYRISWTGTGTMSASFTGYVFKH